MWGKGEISAHYGSLDVIHHGVDEGKEKFTAGF
jgi:hypothetical protein